MHVNRRSSVEALLLALLMPLTVSLAVDEDESIALFSYFDILGEEASRSLGSKLIIIILVDRG